MPCPCPVQRPLRTALEALICDDHRFALQANDSSIDHVKGNHAFNGLIGVNQGKGNLIAAAYDTVAHALFFANLLNAKGGATSGINRSRLLVSSAFSDHGEPLLVSAEIYAAAFQKVNLLDGPSGPFSNDVLVTEKRPTTDGVFPVAAVVGLLQRG